MVTVVATVDEAGGRGGGRQHGEKKRFVSRSRILGSRHPTAVVVVVAVVLSGVDATRSGDAARDPRFAKYFAEQEPQENDDEDSEEVEEGAEEQDGSDRMLRW